MHFSDVLVGVLGTDIISATQNNRESYSARQFIFFTKVVAQRKNLHNWNAVFFERR